MIKQKEGSGMKKARVYNVIFPIWALMFFPPTIFIALAGNFIVDSVVLLIAGACLRIGAREEQTLGRFYGRSIIKVWLLGFLADFIGTLPLWIIFEFGLIEVAPEMTAAIYTNLFQNTGAVLLVLACIAIAGVCIYFFNYRFSLKKSLPEVRERKAVSLVLAIVTAPWTLLLPTELFLHVF